MTETGPLRPEEMSGGSPPEEDGPTSPDAYPTISQALWLLLITVVLQGLFQLGADAAGDALGIAVMEHPAGLALVNALAFGMAIAWGWSKTGSPAREVFWFRSFPVGLLPAMTALILGAGIVFSEVDNAVRSVFPMPEDLAEVMARVVGPDASLWGSFLLLVIVAPFSEELLFRGVLLRGFEARYSKWAAIVTCGLLFGFIHLNPWQFLATSGAGVILAWWTLETRSLWPAIYGHALNNSLPFTVERIPGLDIPGFTGGPGSPVQFQPLWLDVLGAVLAGWGLAYLLGAFRDEDPPPSASGVREYRDPSP